MKKQSLQKLGLSLQSNKRKQVWCTLASGQVVKVELISLNYLS